MGELRNDDKGPQGSGFRVSSNSAYDDEDLPHARDADWETTQRTSITNPRRRGEE